MLVLSRKIGERILLGNGVVVTVLDVLGGRVRLGIEAPQAVRIFREELAGPSQDSRKAPGRNGSRPKAAMPSVTPAPPLPPPHPPIPR